MIIKLSFSAKVGRKRRQKPQQCGSPTKTPLQSTRTDMPSYGRESGIIWTDQQQPVPDLRHRRVVRILFHTTGTPPFAAGQCPVSS